MKIRSLNFSDINDYLKMISALSNYGGGELVFNINDNIQQACVDIDRIIRESIIPVPDYVIKVINGKKGIKIIVKDGLRKPYLYKSKAYKRNDSATIEVDSLEFTRLVLEGKNISFEELPYGNNELTFEILKKRLQEHIQLHDFNKDILKTLNLYDEKNGYNNAAGILADINHFPGIDLVKFGDSISIIEKRITFENISVLDVYERTVEVYRDYYQYEVINGMERETVEKIPEAAFREAIANALIHRVWDVNSHIRISMFSDKIEIVSPGGLPSGISENEYLSGKLSVLRNRNLANVFYRLGFVEIFGTGITRIKQLYEGALRKPTFEVSEHAIKIILPTIEVNEHLSLDERVIYESLSKTVGKSISDIVNNVAFGRSKVSKLLKNLVEKGIVSVEGNRRGTKYILK